MKATYLAHGSSSNLRAPIGNGTNWCTNWCSHQPSTNIYGAIYRRINCLRYCIAVVCSICRQRAKCQRSSSRLGSGTPRPMMHGCTSVKHLGGAAKCQEAGGRAQEFYIVQATRYFAFAALHSALLRNRYWEFCFFTQQQWRISFHFRLRSKLWIDGEAARPYQMSKILPMNHPLFDS